MRIVILGCAGTGKTTLARKLGERAGVPVVCLDAIWKPHWGDKEVPAFRRLVQDAHAGEQWISDGNFAVSTFDIRLPRATMVIWLERSRLSCAWRSTRRVFQSGEAHRLGRLNKVLAFIWRFDRVNRPRIEAMRDSYGPFVPIRRLTSSHDVSDFLASDGDAAHYRVLS